jgi:hypothetical protein
VKSHLTIALLALFQFNLFAAQSQNVLDDLVTPINVTWSTPGANENDSMPIGNGDIAANVWTEQNGDLALLVAKSDALTEWGKLVKLGRVGCDFSCRRTHSPAQGILRRHCIWKTAASKSRAEPIHCWYGWMQIIP